MAGVGIILPGIWQCLETFLVVIKKRMLEARDAAKQTKIHKNSTSLPPSKSYPPQILKVLKLRIPEINTSPGYKPKMPIYKAGSLQKVNFRE